MLTDRQLVAYWAKITLTSPADCWEWVGARNEKGYGRFWTARYGLLKAHRVSYQLAHPDEDISGWNVCHSCDNRICCNPNHLWLGTTEDNNKDMLQKGRYADWEDYQDTKLNPEKVAEIKQRRWAGETRKKIALEFGVSIAAIQKIDLEKTWKFVPWPEGKRIFSKRGRPRKHRMIDAAET